ncbi:hypothetical protein Noda2021_11400 [Candidatus Dependentiae bacterium Noda2021]|nr:hypothetical protein Noda2021_11400 [Candidatus Dependentiae bacterium Noda2021]
MKLKFIAVLPLLVIASFEQCNADSVLVFGGKTGWIGQKIVRLLEQGNHQVLHATSRLENRQDLQNEIAHFKPDYIINAAGLTGKPNVDWCETHKEQTIRVNVLGTVTLADVANEYNIHVTNISTGCIYEYDAEHPMYSGKGFTEDEEPNFDGSFYSHTKIILEQLLLEYPNVLNLRIKMPVSLELDKGFVGKIINYPRVVNIPNSLSVLDDLLPLAVDMTVKKIKGNFNLVNPGAISHHEVLDLYKQYIDSKHQYESLTVQEQDATLKARRANAELSAAKLLTYYPDVPHIKDSLVELFKKIAAQKN